MNDIKEKVQLPIVPQATYVSICKLGETQINNSQADPQIYNIILYLKHERGGKKFCLTIVADNGGYFL
jgi:hypothetical protein